MAVEKVSISMPAAVLRAMKREAEERGISVSQVCTNALIRYLGLECPHCGQVYDGKGKKP